VERHGQTRNRVTGQKILKISFVLRYSTDDINRQLTGCYASRQRVVQHSHLAGFQQAGPTNYAGVAGAAGDFDTVAGPAGLFAQWIGTMYNRSEATLGQLTVQDGTSNTLLFGESLGGQGIGFARFRLGLDGLRRDGHRLGLGRPTSLRGPQRSADRDTTAARQRRRIVVPIQQQARAGRSVLLWRRLGPDYPVWRHDAA